MYYRTVYYTVYSLRLSLTSNHCTNVRESCKCCFCVSYCYRLSHRKNFRWIVNFIIAFDKAASSSANFIIALDKAGNSTSNFIIALDKAGSSSTNFLIALDKAGSSSSNFIIALDKAVSSSISSNLIIALDRAGCWTHCSK